MTDPQSLADAGSLRAEDAAARSAALDTGRSFIVQAPAGSGKTELLIQRYLALLARVDAPEEIVAITFTRKATAEMRARVLEALRKAASAAPERPHEQLTWNLARAALVRDRGARWDLAANPNRMRVQTIDALCHWLTLQMPLLAGFGAQPGTVEDATELYQEAARRVLAELDSANERAAHVATLLRHVDNHVERARDLLAGMLGVRDQWIRSVAHALGKEREALQAALANATRDALTGLAELIPAEAQAELISLACYAAENLEAAGTRSEIRHCLGMTAIPGADPRHLDEWRGIAELFLNQDGSLRKVAGARIGFPAANAAKGPERRRLEAMKARFAALLALIGSHRMLVEQLRFTRVLPPAVYGDRQWRAVEALVGLLPLASAQLEVLFRERGKVDFTAVAQAAVRALGDAEGPTDLALALDHRIRHILVDEFQDTSWSQADLLRGLTAGWERNDGRTLFVVGDPMQSIYRFRKAEVGLYLRAWHEGVGTVKLERLRLAVNFRSARAVVDWFNRAFSEALPDQEDLASGAVPFTASVTHEHAREGAAPEFHALLTMDRATEARRVVELVERARSEEQDGSIAILVRSRTHLAEIAPMLKDAGLRFQAIEVEHLGHRPIVQDLLALTRALVHPADRIAWLAVLRAPWCGLTLADLDALAGHDHDRTVWTLMNESACCARLSDDGQARLARLRAAFARAFGSRRREPLRRWIESAWLAAGGPACAENVTDLDDAHVFFELMDELDAGGDLPRLESLEERASALYAAPDSHPGAQGLQLMTIHKAKGLEFDTVIVPGLGRPPRLDDPRLLLWLERPRGHAEPDLLLAPIREASAEADPIYEYLKELDRAKEEHEAARLLYVAATRARSRLHLIGQVDWKEGKSPQPKSRSLLEHLWPVVASRFEQAAGGPDPAPQSTIIHAAPAPPVIRRLVSGWTLPAPPEGVARPPRVGAAYRVGRAGGEVEFSWASETAKHVGTVVHRNLQAIVRDGLPRWNVERVEAKRAVYRRDLARLGVPESEMQNAVVRVVEALTAVLTDQRGRWVLGPHEQAESELRLTGVLDDEIVSVAIDRTFVDEAGTRWIVDYKTGVHEGGDVEGFLDREQQRYRVQLERYAALMRAMDARPIRLGLYFPLLGGWREWG